MSSVSYTSGHMTSNISLSDENPKALKSTTSDISSLTYGIVHLKTETVDLSFLILLNNLMEKVAGLSIDPSN